MLSFPTINNKEKIKLEKCEEDIWNLLKKTFTIPNEFDYKLILITEEYIARPDLLSKELYNTTCYSDLLCKLNGISNPFELNEGMYIIIPSANWIEYFYTISREDKENDNLTVSSTDTKTTQKRKDEPRAANEQIIGDSNFRIDKNNKIVIY